MRAVCVISNSPASPFGARSPRGELDTPPVQWQTVCRWYGGLQSMCETVSAASAEAAACRWCFRDVRKLIRPFDTASSSESESQRPKWRNFNGEPVHAASPGRDTNPGHMCQGTWLAANCYRLITSRHIGRFWERRTASWDGVITWPISVKKETLCRNSSHHHTHRFLILSVGVPRLVTGREQPQVVSVTTEVECGGRWV